MTFNPCPKSKPIRYYGKAYTEFRLKVYEHHKGKCSICKLPAPLNHPFNPGTVRHIKSHGAGGEDTIENTTLAHLNCHRIKDHSPRWSCMEENKS